MQQSITTNCQSIAAVLQLQLFIRLPQSIKANLQGCYELRVSVHKIEVDLDPVELIAERFGQAKPTKTRIHRIDCDRHPQSESHLSSKSLETPKILQAQLPLNALRSSQLLQLIVSLQSSQSKQTIWQYKYQTTITLMPFRRFLPMSLDESTDSTIVEVILQGFVVRVQNVRCSAYQKAQNLLKLSEEYLGEVVKEAGEGDDRENTTYYKHRLNKLELTSNTAFKSLQSKIKDLSDKTKRIVLENLRHWKSLSNLSNNSEHIIIQTHDQHGFFHKITQVFQGKSRWKTTIPQIDSVHLVVLVHGMNGNSVDFKKIKQYATSNLKSNNIIFYASKSNESKTETGLQLQGQALAEQILRYLHNSQDTVSKISFIGHSLGGLIVRAALPHLTLCAHRLQGYISLSTPHLGYLQSSKLLGLGIRLLMKSKNSHCIKELLFEDAERLEDCYLSRLANSEGLNWFKRIVFFGAVQDKYIPVESALVQSNSPALSKVKADLLKGLTANCLVRYRINFNIAETSFDSLIGRTAHIRFLQDKTFAALLTTILHSWNG